MMDALMIYGFVASMRHAVYLSFAAAVLGLAEAHYPGLRDAVLRATAWLVSAWARTVPRLTAVPHCRVPAESTIGSAP
jgi:hypothetical protein